MQIKHNVNKLSNIADTSFTPKHSSYSSNVLSTVIMFEKSDRYQESVHAYQHRINSAKQILLT